MTATRMAPSTFQPVTSWRPSQAANVGAFQVQKGKRSGSSWAGSTPVRRTDKARKEREGEAGMEGNLAGYNRALWLLDIKNAMGSFFILNATIRFQKMVGFSRANC